MPTRCILLIAIALLVGCDTVPKDRIIRDRSFYVPRVEVTD